MAYCLKDTAILNAKGTTFRCILMGIIKNEGLKTLNNSVIYDTGHCIYGFCPNKTPIKIIKESAFGGTYFRDAFSNINKKWCKNSWKTFVHLKIVNA